MYDCCNCISTKDAGRCLSTSRLLSSSYHQDEGPLLGVKGSEKNVRPSGPQWSATT